MWNINKKQNWKLMQTCCRMTGSEITMKREDEKIAWGFRLTGGADLGTPFYVVKVSSFKLFTQNCQIFQLSGIWEKVGHFVFIKRGFNSKVAALGLNLSQTILTNKTVRPSSLSLCCNIHQQNINALTVVGKIWEYFHIPSIIQYNGG